MEIVTFWIGSLETERGNLVLLYTGKHKYSLCVSFEQRSLVY